MAPTQSTLPKRPYLLRAYYDWLCDNDFTPFLVVDAEYPNVDVPMEYVQDGQIVLNLSPRATGNFVLGDKAIEFDARFQGVTRHIYVPMGAAAAIYARENGDGVMFEPETAYEINAEQPKDFSEATETSTPKATAKDKEKSDGASFLRIVK